MNEGQQITPTLRLVRLLGEGAMGSVWIAEHLALRTQVAVKFMSPTWTRHESLVQRFRQEAVAAAQIKSPHIAQVFDHGVTPEGVSYIVMELLEGEDLSARVKRVGRMSPRDTANIISQVAKALARAHQLSIVHRDIKPGNIFLVDLDGELLAKVLDFGIAKLGAETNLNITETGATIGTPLYMSPEQFFSAKHIDARSDLWSLGVVAYFMMTGRVPFHAETLGALTVAIHEGVYPPPSSLQPDITPAIDAWFEKALQRQPENRFKTAKEMAEALDRAVGLSRNVSLPDAGTADTPAVTPPAVSPSVGDSAPGEPNSQGGKVGRTLGGITRTRSASSGRRTLLMLAVALVTGAALVGGLFTLSRQRSAALSKSEKESPTPAALSLSSSASLDAAPAAVPAINTVTVTAGPSVSPLPESAAPAAPATASSLLTSSGRLASSATATPLSSPRKSTAPRSSSSARTSTPVKDTIGF